MDCFYPVLTSHGQVPCGTCIPCLKRRQSDWTFRLTEELKVSSSCHFITLTYDESSVPTAMLADFPLGQDLQSTNVLCKRDVQLWMKRLRKYLGNHKIRFFLCGEYGSKTLRPHYHAIIFNFPDSLNLRDYLQRSWKKGFVTISSVTPARIAYVAKYVSCYTFLPRRLRDKRYRPFILCSRRPAIGSNYLSDSKVSYHRETLITYSVDRSGRKVSLPRYYRDRIFDDQMKYDIRERSNLYRERRDKEFQSKYFTPEYEGRDMYQEFRDNYTAKYMNKINKRSL